MRNKKYLYIADQNRNQIDIFPLRGNQQPQVGTITTGIDGPYGLWFDRHRLLYVANQNNDTVTVYQYGSTTPERTFSQGLSRPLYPIVDRKGDLFVGNAHNGTVVEYQSGSTTVYRTLQTPGVEADGMAFDREGNLYVAYRTSPVGPGSIEEFPRGSAPGRVLGMTLNQPQGVIVDNDGNVLAVETGGTNRIDVFPPGSQTASLEVPLPCGSTPTQLAIQRNEAFLYISALSGIVFGVIYPLRGQNLFLKDRVIGIIQGVTISNNQAR